jgi:hypothetical protein
MDALKISASGDLNSPSVIDPLADRIVFHVAFDSG